VACPLVLLVLVAGSVSPARADRFAIGASVGASRGGGGTSYLDSMTSRGVFARLRLFGRLSVEAELGQVDLAQPDTTLDYGAGTFDAHHAKLGTASLRYDLAPHGSVLPHVLAGLGVENWTNDYIEWDYSKRELGLGVDVVITDGLRLGLDLRAGKRELIGTRQTQNSSILVYMPAPFPEQASSYTSARVTLGATF